MMKKTLVAVFVMAIIFSATAALAAEGAGDVNLATKIYAYMDLEAAPEVIKDNIIEARKTIIYSESWTVDGQCEIVRGDGSIVSLPEFYDLFPEDWDIPVSEASLAQKRLVAPTTLGTRAIIYYGPVMLVTPPSGVNASEFCWFLSTGKPVYIAAITLPGSTYNAGFNNNAGVNVGYGANLGPRDELVYRNPVSGNGYACRASTFSTNGYANLQVGER